MPDPREVTIVDLPDGRSLSYAEHGDPDGVPVVFFHGTPGSHVEGGLLHDAACRLGVRILSPDRPGMGDSTYQSGRTLLDWPRDVAAFAEIVGIDRLRIIGYSGGGPYALACSRFLADSIDTVNIVSGSAPMDRPEVMVGSSLLDRAMVQCALRWPRASDLMIGGMAAGARARPSFAVRFVEPNLTEVERAAMTYLVEADDRRKLAGFLESTYRGPRGATWDYRATAEPWGFLPEAIEVPVDWWHGTVDDVVPLHQAQDLVTRIPDARLHLVADAAHLALRVAAGPILEAAVRH